MSGYRWDPVFRVAPVNGPETVYWLSDRLTDVGSHTRITLRYPETMNVREDINRSLRPVVMGIRPEVDIECVILSMADQQFLGEIEAALLQPRDYNVYLSLDGGCVYRAVALAGISNADPIAGKTVVGAKFTLRVRCVDLIPTRPTMMTDPTVGEELTSDGGFESWTAGALNSWSGSSGVGTVAQETTIISLGTPLGTSSAKVTRSDATTAFTFNQTLAKNPTIGAWYRFYCDFRGSIDLALGASGPVRVKIKDNANAVRTDGVTWGGVGANSMSILGAVSGSTFTTYTLYFRRSITSKWDATFTVNFDGLWAAGESLYIDRCSLYGPILRPGVATW